MLRKSFFAGSWYPSRSREIKKTLEAWTKDIEAGTTAYSGIVPHAGWYYSGRIAARVAKTVCSGADLVIIAGGHLPPGAGILAASEDEIQTPFGNRMNRTDLIDMVKKELGISEDIYRDNTVEVIVPMAVHFAPDAELLCVRLPADEQAIEFAEIIHRATEKSGRNTVFLGSTDLTHYGKNYYYEPAGRGAEGLEWMKTVNDARIIDRLTGMKLSEAIETGVNEKSACSIGAAAAAGRFAELYGATGGRLIEYTTSYDIQPADSFVGYAGILYGT